MKLIKKGKRRLIDREPVERRVVADGAQGLLLVNGEPQQVLSWQAEQVKSAPAPLDTGVKHAEDETPTETRLKAVPRQQLGKGVSPEELAAKAQAEAAKPRRKPKPKPLKQFMQLLEQTKALKDRQAWDEMEPKHFVALYYGLHQSVYGVEPDEVRHDYVRAVQTARRLLEQRFGGDKCKLVAFMKWAWTRERRRAAGRDETDSFRISWQYQFGPRLSSDYVVAAKRRRR